MKRTKQHSKVMRLGIVVFAAVGALVITAGVFAGGDHQPHEINSHVHTNDTDNAGVEWIVKVGRLEWNSTSTYCWHKVFAKNNTNDSVTGEWEWKHFVKNSASTWSKTDKILTDINFRANRKGSQELSRSGWTSIDLPGAGTYRIEAYTRIDMVKDGSNNITGTAGQRDIMSIWFETGE